MQLIFIMLLFIFILSLLVNLDIMEERTKSRIEGKTKLLEKLTKEKMYKEERKVKDKSVFLDEFSQ